jgi:diguanylate cyclase (GGDEF)-like protein
MDNHACDGWVSIVILPVDGDIIVLLVVFLLLVDMHRNRPAVETFRDRFFRQIVVVCLCTIMCGLGSTLCDTLLGDCPRIIFRMLNSFYHILLLLTVFLWLFFSLINFKAHEKQTFLSHPIICAASGLLFFFTHSHLPVNLAICLTIITTYLLIQYRQLSYDLLTGLENRTAFLNHMERLLSHQEKGCVLVANIQNFKYFNQKFGQINGDRLLQSLGEFFVTISPGHRVFRYGGDQFAMVMGEADIDKALTITRTIHERFSTSWTIGKTNASITTRLGLVTFPSQAKTAGELVNALDIALSEAKIQRTSDAVIYDQGLMDKHQRKQEIIQAIKRAVDQNHFILQYQPIYEISSNKIYSAEALIRLDDGILGLIMPNEFIPIAEETGMIVELTYLIIQRVCELWKQIGNEKGDLKRICINLSAVHFLQPRMELSILQIIKSNGVSPLRIKFELTESMLVESFTRVKQVMQTLSKQGVTFSMDDYGRGYSSIEYLINLPFSTVKLDRSIIANCDTHYDLLESIVIMLRRLGKKIVAEGVETESQLQAVSQAGADRVQGFYFSKPITGQQLITLIREPLAVSP